MCNTIWLVENRRQKRNYLPEPRFQLRFVRFLVVGSLIQTALVCAILFYFLGENYRILVKHAGLEPEITTILFRELRNLIGVLSAVFLLHIIGVSFMGFFFSHRVGGAIYALKRTINEINEGHDVELKLRRRDEFQDMADAFNLMVRNLRSGKIPKRGAAR